MSRIKMALMAMIAVFAIGAVSASAASAATGRVDVNGGSGCDYATAGSVSVPSTIPGGDIFTTGCDIFGTDAEITGDIDVSAGGTGEIRLTPAGTDVQFKVKLFGSTLCTVTVTSPNYVSLTGGPSTYSGTIPVTSPTTAPANATASGGACPSLPFDINMSMTLP
jgi:hypothetical protein